MTFFERSPVNNSASSGTTYIVRFEGKSSFPDAEVKLYLDGKLLGSGSVRKGFAFSGESVPGTHNLLVTFQQRRFQLSLYFPDLHHYRIDLSYNPATGFFDRAFITSPKGSKEIRPEKDDTNPGFEESTYQMILPEELKNMAEETTDEIEPYPPETDEEKKWWKFWK